MPAPGPSTRRLLLVIGGAVSVLCVIFGTAIVSQQRTYQAYHRASLESGPMRWETESMSPDECVAFSVDWAMGCPGLGTWCESEAPRLVMSCMASRDRTSYCSEHGDAVARTDFGYQACAQLREGLDGRQAVRGHKKFCASAQRAVAQHCRSLSR